MMRARARFCLSGQPLRNSLCMYITKTAAPFSISVTFGIMGRAMCELLGQARASIAPNARIHRQRQSNKEPEIFFDIAAAAPECMPIVH